MTSDSESGPGEGRTDRAASSARNATARASTHTLLGPLALLAASALWGGMYPVMKRALLETQPFTLITLEYLVAVLVLLPVAAPRLRRTPPTILLKALGMGLLWFGGVSLVFLGLRETSAGLSAFIVIQTAVVTPILVGLSGGGWFDRRLGGAIVLVLGGMAVIFLLGEEVAFAPATALIALAVVLLSVHMIVLGKLTHQAPAPVLVWVQVAVTCGGAAVISFFAEQWPAVPSGLGPWTRAAILYGGLGSSLLAVLLQTLGQRITPVTHVGIFLSLESVFAVLLSIALGVESLEARTALGFTLVFAGTVLAQTGLRRESAAAAVEEQLELQAPL
ncbi:MAG: DMT family transporter [Actinobacteria bacterium]|nr:DMT family transporter [Actinomycetota bacterium]